METSVNNKCRAFTSLQQSKKLAEILPLESADMCYVIDYAESNKYGTDHFKLEVDTYGLKVQTRDNIPCWSLAALMNLLPNCTDIVKEEADTKNEKYMCTVGVKNDIISTFGNNPVDACVSMTEHLHGLKML